MHLQSDFLLAQSYQSLSFHIYETKDITWMWMYTVFHFYFLAMPVQDTALARTCLIKIYLHFKDTAFLLKWNYSSHNIHKRKRKDHISQDKNKYSRCRRCPSNGEGCTLINNGICQLVFEPDIHVHSYPLEVRVKGQEIQQEGSRCCPLRSGTCDMQSKPLCVCVFMGVCVCRCV